MRYKYRNTIIILFLLLTCLSLLSRSNWGFRSDETMINFVQINSPAWFVDVMAWVTLLGSDEFIAIVMVILGLFFVVKKQPVNLVMLLLVVGGGILLNFLLKISFQRLRPGDMYTMDVFGIDTGIPSYSFPSGHTMRGCLLVLFVLYLVWSRLQSNFAKWIAYVVSACVMVAVALSRVVLGAHFPTDTLAAIVASFAWFFVCLNLGSRMEQRGGQRHVSEKNRHS